MKVKLVILFQHEPSQIVLMPETDFERSWLEIEMPDKKLLGKYMGDTGFIMEETKESPK